MTEPGSVPHTLWVSCRGRRVSHTSMRATSPVRIDSFSLRVATARQDRILSYCTQLISVIDGQHLMPAIPIAQPELRIWDDPVAIACLRMEHTIADTNTANPTRKVPMAPLPSSWSLCDARTISTGLGLGPRSRLLRVWSHDHG